MLKYITGRAYKPPTVETVLDYSGDEMPAAQRRKRSKERDQAQREKRKAEKDVEIRSVVSTRSSKSGHSSRESDAMREERRKERRERRNKDRDCASSVSTSSASRVSRRVGSMVVKLPDAESLKTPEKPAAAAISAAHAITGRKRSPTMPTTLPTMRSLESEERDRPQTPRPVREQRSDPTLKASTKPEKSSVEPAPAATTPALPSAAVQPAPVTRVRTASPGLGGQFPPPPHDIATPPHTPNSKAPMPIPEVVPAQQLPPTPVAEDELAKHNEALTGALVRRAHRPHIRTGSEVRFASPATDGARTPAPRSGWKPPQHRHHSEGYEQAAFTPQPYYRQESNGRHKGELPPPPDYLYWQQRPQSAAGYYHQQGYYPQPYSPPTSHSQATPPSPPESAKSQPLPERERDPVTRSSSAKPIRHSLPPPPPSQHDYYAYYQHRLITPPSQTPPLHHVPRYPPPPPTSADLEFLGPAPKRERKRRHSVHYPSSVYEPQQHMQYQHHNRVMTPVEGISPMSRPFHDFPPPGANLKRLAPSRLALSPPSSGSNESHRPPPRPEFTPNGSRDVFRFMDEAQEEADDRKARNLDFDNETTVTSMIAVSAEYPTRERRPGVQRFVRRRAPEEVEYRAAMWGIRKEGAGEKMEREESVASGGSGISGVPLPLPAPAKVVVGIESEKFRVERPKLLPPVEFCEEVPVFEEEDEVVDQVVEGVEEVPEKGMLVVDEVEVADTLEQDIEEKLELEEELGQSEEDEDGDEAEEEVEDGQDEDEEEEDCDTVVGFDSGEVATEIFTEGVSVVGGRLESVEECHDEEEEEREEGSELEEEEEEAEDEETEEDDLHEPHMEEHQQATSSTHGGSDLGVSIDPDGEEDDQTAEGFLANLDNSSPPASSIFSTKSSATTVISLDSMFNPSTNQSSASSVPTTISTITDYSSGSSSASYIPQYMPAAFAYAPSPPPSTITSSTDYHGSTTNSSATTQYPMRNPHLMGMGVEIPHTPPRTQPGTRNTSPLWFKRTPLFPQQAGVLPVTPTESQVFPRFTSLNLRLLRHLEGELMGLERMLEEIEARMVNEDTQIPHENVSYHHVDGASPHGSVRSRVSSGSSDPSLSGEAGEMGAKRAEIMDALAWKLGQYNQALVNYQAMMDTFGPVLDPCSSPTRRPASRDSGVASSRGSSGVRHSDCATTSETGTSEYDGGEESEGYESLPGGWGVQEQEQEVGKAKASETHEPGEASMKQDIDIVLTGKRPTRSVSPSLSSCCPSHATYTHSTLSPSPKPLQSPETTLTQILVPPALLLVVLCSLEWISSWGKILGLAMVFGVGKAWKGGVEEGEKRGQMARGRGRSGGARRVRERERYGVEE